MNAVRKTRDQPGLDELRGATTLLVVLHHAAITYGAIGGWYYREVATSSALPIQALVFFCTVNQSWFMGLFFLLAGYFTPPALARKGLWPFVMGRLMRLGVPLLVYGYVIGPFTIALAATSSGKSFGQVWLVLLKQGRFENGPLWFAQALLLMTMVALVGWRLRGRLPQAADSTAAAFTPKTEAWPTNWVLALGALLTGAAAWLLRNEWPVGVNVWGLQLGYFASYAVLFAFGCRASRSAWLQDLPPRTVQVWRWVARLALPVLPVLYLLGGRMPGLRGSVLDAVYAFWEPLVAWGVILALLQRFQRPQAHDSPGWAALSRRAFAIYVIHPPVLVAVALAWRGVAAPALLKFAVTGSVACVLCFVLAGWVLRVPRLARIL